MGENRDFTRKWHWCTVAVVILGLIVPPVSPVMAAEAGALPEASGRSLTRYLITSRSLEELNEIRIEIEHADGFAQEAYSEVGLTMSALLSDEQVHALREDPRVVEITPDAEIRLAESSEDKSDIIEGEYIVVLREGAGADVLRQVIEPYASSVDRVYTQALSGFSATLTPQQVKALERNQSVEHVEPNRRISLGATQTGPTWGLDRIDQRNLPLNGQYSYQGDGQGVTAYVIDTGTQASHPQFEGRVGSGYGIYARTDCQGHGTHVAGTVGSALYGVAKKVSIVPVQVLDCDGRGSSAGVIQGLDWVVSHHTTSRAVANMSLGGAYSAALNLAAQAVVNDGIVLVVAAGNESSNACGSSPASLESAVTVGATDQSDARAFFSNHGSCLDIFAPGVQIRSTTMGSSNNVMDGTSMAAPHVAGAAAVMWSLNPGLSASQVVSTLISSSTPGKVTDARTGSPNRLLHLAPAAGTPPTAPRSPSATLSGGVVTLTWQAPISTGSSAVTSYTAVTSLGSSACSWTTGPLQCQVHNLSPGSYSFKVAASNAAGTSGYSSLSNTVTISSVNNNDYFAGSRALSGLSGSITDSNVGATRESGEPQTFGATAATKWYTFTASSTAMMTVNLVGSSFDTVLGVYRGASLAGLTQVAVDDDTGGDLTSRVSFTAQSGTTYRIQVGGYATGSVGAISLSWSVATSQSCSTVVVNDNILCATVLSGSGTTSTNTAYATLQSSYEPYYNISCRSVWYRIRPSSNGAVSLSVSGSFDVVLSVHRSPYDPLYWDDLTTVAFSDEYYNGNEYVSNLSVIAGYDYFVRVAGYDDYYCEYGTASLTWSISSSASVPGSPGSVSAIAATSSADVSWSAPASNGGSAVTSYEVTSSPGGYTCVSTTTSCTVTGLPYGSYTFSVKARNQVGWGPASSPSSAVVVGNANDDVAGALTLVSGSTFGRNDYATEEDDEPVHAEVGGGKSMWYRYSPTSTRLAGISSQGSSFDTVLAVYESTTAGDFDLFSEVVSNDDATNLTGGASQVTWLAEAGTTYYIAVDGYYNGSQTAVGSFTLTTTFEQVTPPSSPVDVRASAGDGRAHVAWAAPASGGSTITSYTVTSSPGGRTCISSAVLRRCSVTGLSNGVAYTFSVRSTNLAGDSAPSAASTAVTPRTGTEVTAVTNSWALDRVNQTAGALDGFTTYVGRGAGVRIYVVDTGVMATHTDFGDRVASGTDKIGSGDGTEDCDGHGTHVASLAAGEVSGLATQATIVPVRVLNCSGSGSITSVVAGLNWIAADIAINGTDAVVNMSLGASASGDDGALLPIDNAVSAIVAAGVPVVVAAGNSSAAACGFSPARVPAAITVAASTATDTMATFSNHGGCVDLLAPGASVPGASNEGSSDFVSLSGTSMAAPVVAGFVAVMIGLVENLTPAQVSAILGASATTNSLTQLPNGTANRLLFGASRRCAILGFMGIACGTLAISNTSLTAPVGSSVTLATTGGLPGRPVSYVVTGSGCALNSSSLSRATAGVCSVHAVQNGSSVDEQDQQSPTLEFSFFTINQAPLRITNRVRTSKTGRWITLQTSGGTGAGAVTFSTSSAGCRISGRRVTASRPSTCIVVATKAAWGGYRVAQSLPMSFSFRR